MEKSVIRVGYKEYVLDTNRAVQLLALLEDAELYEKCWCKTGDNSGAYTHHVYTEDKERDLVELRLMPKALYQVARLAGKPEKS
jgi:hypothetical protein